MNKVYFPNLNGLRFIAALLVIIHHVEQFKSLLGYENHKPNVIVNGIGKLGVILFFVLSGFLITYLLLAEEEETKTISVKDFYIRRILRIWPLYYLVIVLSFFIFSRISFLEISHWSALLFERFSLKLILFIVFLPNLALITFPPVPYASQAWSVGVEEQFYFLWPVLMKKVKNKAFVLYSVIISYLFIFLVGFPILKLFYWSNYIQVVKEFMHFCNIDCMAIGGVFALYLFKKNKILAFFYHKYVQLFTLIAVIGLIISGYSIPYVYVEIMAVLFGVIILNLASNLNCIMKLEYRPINYLGKISYGLYMFHPLGIIISLKVLNHMGTRNIILQYFFCILLTTVIAGISYHFFESYFIRKKAQFSKILSGDIVRVKNIQ